MKRAVLLLALASPAYAAVDFAADIAPLIFKHCAPCHRPGDVGPFPLTSYSEVRRHASQIARVTRSRDMPPWLPAPGSGDFVGSRRLTTADIDLIARWVRGGMQEGNSALAPPQPVAAPEWQLGPPDLILQIPHAFTLPASGEDVFRNFVVNSPPGETRFVRAIEIRPGNRQLVHHANVVIDRARTLRARDGMDGQPGFPGMDISTESGDSFDPDSHFLFWKPGSPPEVEPTGLAWRLEPETDLVLNLHLRPSGKPEQIQPAIGLYYSNEPPTRFPMLLQLEHDSAIDIPAGSKTFAVTDHLKLPVAVDLLRIYPHAHYLGQQIEAWATLPDGSKRKLITIDNWNLDWQGVFTYRQPVHLPATTVVEMRIQYDNSAANPRNPASPPVRVRAGNRSRDEMGHVWLQVLPTNPGPRDARLALQEAAMSRRLQKDPADFLAHYNLGALFESEGQHEAAVTQFAAAVRIDSSHAVARNALAAGLLASGRNQDALREWKETVRLAPSYSAAHFNLAHLLAALDDAPEAIAEYRIYLGQQPADVEAHLTLGGIYIALDRFEEAIPEYAKACELDPANANTLTDYGTLLARTGHIAEAILRFEAALRLDPLNRIARANLDRAKTSLSR